jgi:hypothetical protein
LQTVAEAASRDLAKADHLLFIMIELHLLMSIPQAGISES